MLSRLCTFCFLLTFIIFIPLRLSGTMLIPLNLEEISSKADKIFVGVCQSVEIDLDENDLPSTYVTYKVEEGIKGSSPNWEVIKLFGTDQKNNFSPNEREILFLYEESSLGFTSPVGYGQGRFQILQDEHGDSTVQSHFYQIFTPQNNSNVLSQTKLAKQIGEGSQLKDFIKTVQEIVSRREGK